MVEGIESFSDFVAALLHHRFASDVLRDNSQMRGEACIHQAFNVLKLMKVLLGSHGLLNRILEYAGCGGLQVNRLSSFDAWSSETALYHARREFGLFKGRLFTNLGGKIACSASFPLRRGHDVNTL